MLVASMCNARKIENTQQRNECAKKNMRAMEIGEIRTMAKEKHTAATTN